MQTILDILKHAGGWHHGLHLTIANPPFGELDIEAMEEFGPQGLPALSVVQFGEQNSDLMRDPEMCFELGFAGGAHLNPFYWRNDFIGVEQSSRFLADGMYVHDSELHKRHEDFAALWDDALRRQGAVEAFTRQPAQPA